MPNTNRGSRALYYRYGEGCPSEFWEVRLRGPSVTIRSGRVRTRGETEARSYPSDAEAHAAFRELAAAKAGEGFQSAYEGEYVPGVCDFKALTLEIREGARRAFAAVRKANPEETVSAYALVSDDGAMTIGPVCSSEEALRRRAADDGYDPEEPDLDEEDVKAAESYLDELRFGPAEWEYFEGGEFLDLPYRRILAEWFDTDPGDEKDSGRFRAGFFESCVSALEGLDREGFFGTGPAREKTVVLFDVSDTGLPERVTDGWVKRLNPAGVFRRFKRSRGG